MNQSTTNKVKSRLSKIKKQNSLKENSFGIKNVNSVISKSFSTI